MKNQWICKAEKKLISSPVLDIVQRDCVSSEDGKEHRFFLMESRDWCNIIPVTREGKVVLVRQYRIGISQHTLEIPGGVTDPEDSDPLAAAIREMTEETGFAPAPGARSEELGWTFPNPAILNNRQHTFVVGPVERASAQNLDDGEMIEVVETSLDEIPRLIEQGQIRHALTLTALFFLMIRARDGRELLSRELGAYSS
jgi:ADP-ribose pyrophosphatase